MYIPLQTLTSLSETNPLIFWIAPIAGIIAVVASLVLMARIGKMSPGGPKTVEVGNAIREGAYAFLKRQYGTIASLSVAVAVLIYVLYTIWPVANYANYAFQTAFAFILGALCSGIAGFVGMYISVRANIRVASAARTSIDKALKIALRGGAVSGLLVVAMSLLGVAGLFGDYRRSGGG